MNLSDFDYLLPKELIAQYPSEKRDKSRLLVLHKDSGKIEHRIFEDIVEYFHEGDLLVLNDTRVIPAKLTGRKETGGKVEALILHAEGSRLKAAGNEHEALLKPSRGCRVGSKLIFGNGKLIAEITRVENGRRFLRFKSNGNFEEFLEKFGEMPLPPYIKRKGQYIDEERYQTVYASKNGAIAAPTAGLHFTKGILNALSKKGVDIDYVTLHVGYGTFTPVKCEDIRNHRMEKEYFEIEKGLIEKAMDRKGKVIAAGTTSCRVLETVFSDSPHFTPCPEPEPFEELTVPRTVPREVEARSEWFGVHLSPISGWTNLFIYQPYKFGIVDTLITNFHLPKTSLLMLVSAFCGRELLFNAYREAIKKRYRFYSYGDAMLVI